MHTSKTNHSFKNDKLKQVLSLAYNRWDSVFSRYGDLNQAIAKSPSSVPCPQTGNGSTKFRLVDGWERYGKCYHNDGVFNNGSSQSGDGLDVIQWLEGCDAGDAMNIVIEILGGKLTDIKPETLNKVVEQKKSAFSVSSTERRKRAAKIDAVIRSSCPAANHPWAHNYLRSRGLKGDLALLPPSLGFHEGLSYWTGVRSEEGAMVYKDAGKWPCFLPIFHDEQGRVLTLHRHYLNEEGKGKLSGAEEPKRLMRQPSPLRGAMRIDAYPLVIQQSDGRYNAVLGLTEGCETALAVREGTGYPVWACYSDSLLASINIESIFETAAAHIREKFGCESPRINLDLLIFEDKDRSEAGARAAKKLVERCAKYSNVNPIRCIPKGDIKEGTKSQDWLDEYVDKGVSAFPFHLAPELRVPGAL